MHLATVALLSSIGMVVASAPNSLRGSAEQTDDVPRAPIPDSEAEVFDALSDILFGSDIHPDGESELVSAMSAFENGTENLQDLSADSALGSRGCDSRAGSWVGMAERIAPGCLGQCKRQGICEAIGRAVGVWTRTHNKRKARHAVCKYQNALRCLLSSNHKAKCKKFINMAPNYGIPLSVGKVCHRRLEEAPGLEEAVEASEDALEHYDNMTLDALATAALSSSAGCYAKTSSLRSCGGRCFGRKQGHQRRECIQECLEKKKVGSSSCAGCYAHRSDCTMVNCLTPCARSATGKECTSCVHKKCGGDCR